MLAGLFLRAASKGEIQYVGGRAAGIGKTSNDIVFSLTGLTGGIASQPQQNDLVIVSVVIGVDGGTNLVYNISGYTQIADVYALDSNTTNLFVGYKLMTASPDTSVTFTGGTGNTSNLGVAMVHVFRNANQTTPMDVAATTATVANGTTTDPPAITPVTPGAVILALGGAAHDASARTYTNNGQLNNFLTVGDAATDVDVSIGGGWIAWTSGSFDPNSFGGITGSTTTDSAAAVTLAIRPA